MASGRQLICVQRAFGAIGDRGGLPGPAPTATPVPPTPTPILPLILAEDDWESGGFTGGSGWLNPWDTAGGSATQVRTQDGPHGGSEHLRLRRGTGWASRDVNLTGRSGVSLQFWAKLSGLDSGDTAMVQVSPDGGDYTTVKIWTVSDSDGVYRFYDIDLGGFAMTSQFYVAFASNMSGNLPALFVDDIEVVQ